MKTWVLGAGGAVAAALASSVAPGAYVHSCAEIEDPGPCIQVAGGYPFPFVVDHHLSPANRVDLFSAMTGEGFFVWPPFAADVIFYAGFIALCFIFVRSLDRRPGQ